MDVLTNQLTTLSPGLLRARVRVLGAVQGVGFRPFVHQCATELGLRGWVINTSFGVLIEAEGTEETLRVFLQRLRQDKPALAVIQNFEYAFLEAFGYEGFEILHSDASGEKTAFVLPDIATCPACLKEIFDRRNRRYLYPFTNCTHCGPRYSIIEALPYDRINTIMKSFTMCKRCEAEYHDPSSRRFHAQPNACPECGPRLALWDARGDVLGESAGAWQGAVQAIRDGKIVALKGIGGFQLLADAGNEEAVTRLRRRKHREEKPFALMFPSLKEIEAQCSVSDLERLTLLSSEAPIVLVRRKTSVKAAWVAPSVAPDNPFLGVMVPYSPLHHMLMRHLKKPVVATSGNLSDEPICIDDQEALHRLSGIADVFLVHDRPIARHVDDSVVKMIMGRPQIIRRARGYAPLPVPVKFAHADGRGREGSARTVLAVGGHLKNTVALAMNDHVFLSQHIGDLEAQPSCEAFGETIRSFQKLYEVDIQSAAADLHPDYYSTRYVRQLDVPVTMVQHHHAHVVACMADNEITGTVLGVAWDGTGYGADGTVWGGEFLKASLDDFERVAHLRPFKLPGGDQAIKEPRRAALGALYEIFGDRIFSMSDFPTLQAFGHAELDVLGRMLSQDVQSPWTTSAGRLFDVVASLTGVRQKMNFEGQAAMGLEFLLQDAGTERFYTFDIKEPADSLKDVRGPLVIDWAPMVQEIISDVKFQIQTPEISAKFHNTLVEMIVVVCRRIGEKKVALTGGCFQNTYLTERTVRRLRDEGFQVYWHQCVPPNDGGIALGQAVVAMTRNNKE